MLDGGAAVTTSAPARMLVTPPCETARFFAPTAAVDETVAPRTALVGEDAERLPPNAGEPNVIPVPDTLKVSPEAMDVPPRVKVIALPTPIRAANVPGVCRFRVGALDT